MGASCLVISRRQHGSGRLAEAVLVMLLLAGCVADRENTLSRSVRAREVAAAAAERRQQERELNVLQATNAETLAAIETARAESVRRSAELRAVLADLSHRVSQQQLAEHDLAAARERAREIEQQLQPLRALEQALRERERLRAEALQRVAALQAEVDATAAAAAAKEAELTPRLLALQERLAAAQRLNAAVAAAQAALDAALPKPAVPPAPVEAKK
ncbi:MAG: hypothetical protein ABIP94_05860 [Planctomycetota bacterium]